MSDEVEYRTNTVIPKSNVEETARSLGRPYRFAYDNEAAKRRRTPPHYRRRPKLVPKHEIEFQIKNVTHEEVVRGKAVT